MGQALVMAVVYTCLALVTLHEPTKCCRAHRLEELWACSHDWNVIGQAATLAEINCKTNQILTLHGFACSCRHFASADMALIDS